MDLLEAVKQVALTQGEKLLSMRLHIASEYPTVMKALQLVDSEKRVTRRGFSFVKRENKRHGFLYYVRYPDPANGKYLPSKWNTHTSNIAEAEKFARENKDRLVSRYLESHDKKMYNIIEKFYESGDFEIEQKRSREISESIRRSYSRYIRNSFMPFLKEENIKAFDELTGYVMADYQDWLLKKGLKPQSVNNYLKAVKKVLAYLARKGIIKENIGEKIKSIHVCPEDKKARGCYEVGEIKGIFDKDWDDEKSRILCMLIYTTGMRNNEIKKIRKEDLAEIGGVHFVNIKESKTENGLRLVPLHKNVYDKIIAHSANRGVHEIIFKNVYGKDYKNANYALAKELKYTKEEADLENITFYSGRHYWKTLMNAEGLGEDIEEFFMGHKVSQDVKKLYNHKDKQGQERMAEKAKQVLSILDRCVFCKPEK